jgi:hypothetical protein
MLTCWPIWIGYAACVWALAFAAAHYYWAFGGAWLVGEAGVRQSRELLACDPWYYWVSWMVLSTAFVTAGSFPFALFRSLERHRWIREILIWARALYSCFWLRPSSCRADLRGYRRPSCSFGSDSGPCPAGRCSQLPALWVWG